jgi:hypothetical protein
MQRGTAEHVVATGISLPAHHCPHSNGTRHVHSLICVRCITRRRTTALYAVGRQAADVFESVKRASRGEKTSVHLATAARLLDSGGGSVALKQAEAALGQAYADAHHGCSKEEQRAHGGTALAALVDAGVVSVRPYSTWAQDVPLEAYGPLSFEPAYVVTAASPLHLHCMRLLLEAQV